LIQWSKEMCAMFGVPERALPRVVASSERVGVTAQTQSIPSGIPISGIAGDQQAALFGQACFNPGSSKNTYGTGSFVLMNVGTTCPAPSEGLLTTVAWKLGSDAPVYALEGAIFVTGSAIQWLRDGINIIDSAPEVGPLAESVPSTDGVVVVPAFTGLGSPWWDPYARGAVLGITRGTTRAHIARAVVESISYQTRDVVEAMSHAAGVTVTDMRVDGGAAVMNLLLQLQANQLGVSVMRPHELETTAMGAAYLAGLAEGVWTSLQSVTDAWKLDTVFTPQPTGTETHDYMLWKRAVGRSLNWAQ
jgi:glycerol kinase